MLLPFPPLPPGRDERALEYFSGVFQSLGGAFVLVGGFAAASLSYMPSQHDGLRWLLSVYAAPMCGAYLLTASFALRAVAAGNADLAARLAEWEGEGAVRRRRPQIRACWQPRSVLWWGGRFLTLGALILDIGTTGRLAGQLHAVRFTHVQNLILEKICIAAGGLVLLLGSMCYIGKEVGWIVSKGTMCPPTRKDWRSQTFWLNWCTYWGCMLYFVRGYMPIMHPKGMAPRMFRTINGIGYGVGSAFHMAAGVLLVLRATERDEHPPPPPPPPPAPAAASEPHKKAREDDIIGALDEKLLAMGEVLAHTRDKLCAHMSSCASMYMSPSLHADA